MVSVCEPLRIVTSRKSHESPFLIRARSSLSADCDQSVPDTQRTAPKIHCPSHDLFHCRPYLTVRSLVVAESVCGLITYVV